MKNGGYFSGMPVTRPWWTGITRRSGKDLAGVWAVRRIVGSQSQLYIRSDGSALCADAGSRRPFDHRANVAPLHILSTKSGTGGSSIRFFFVRPCERESRLKLVSCFPSRCMS